MILAASQMQVWFVLEMLGHDQHRSLPPPVEKIKLCFSGNPVIGRNLSIVVVQVCFLDFRAPGR